MSSGWSVVMGESTRVSIPSGIRKTIQDINEITCFLHSEEDVYAMLRVCNMDPNETVEKLLLQDPFHLVKGKKKKRHNPRRSSKEGSASAAAAARNTTTRRSFSSRFVAANGERGSRRNGNSGSFSSRLLAPSTGERGTTGVKNKLAEKQMGVDQGNGKQSKAGVVVRDSGSKSPHSKLSSTVTNGTAIASYTGKTHSPVKADLLSSNEMVTSRTGTYNFQKKLEEGRPSSNHSNRLQPPVSEQKASIDPKEKMMKYIFYDRGHVIFPNHFRVPERVGITFGSFDSSFLWKPNPVTEANFGEGSNIEATQDSEENIGDIRSPKISCPYTEEGVASEDQQSIEQIERSISSTPQISCTEVEEKAISEDKKSFEQIERSISCSPRISCTRVEEEVISEDQQSLDQGARSISCSPQIPCAEVEEEVPYEDQPSFEHIERRISSSPQISCTEVEEEVMFEDQQSLEQRARSVSCSPHISCTELEGELTSEDQQSLEQIAGSSSPGDADISSSIGAGREEKVTSEDVQSFEHAERSISCSPHISCTEVEEELISDDLQSLELIAGSISSGDADIASSIGAGRELDQSKIETVLVPGTPKYLSENPESSKVCDAPSLIDTAPIPGTGSVNNQGAGVMPTTATIQQHHMSIFPQPNHPYMSHYRPNFIPHSQHLSPFYPPSPSVHPFLSNATFPVHPVCNMYPSYMMPAAAPIRFPHFKAGGNNNLGHAGSTIGFGPHNSSSTNYSLTSAASVINPTGNEDLPVHLSGQKREDPTVWNPLLALGRHTSGQQADRYGNIYVQKQPVACTPMQRGHASFPALYHPARIRTTIAPQHSQVA